MIVKGGVSGGSLGSHRMETILGQVGYPCFRWQEGSLVQQGASTEVGCQDMVRKSRTIWGVGWADTKKEVGSLWATRLPEVLVNNIASGRTMDFHQSYGGGYGDKHREALHFHKCRRRISSSLCYLLFCKGHRHCGILWDREEALCF